MPPADMALTKMTNRQMSENIRRGQISLHPRGGRFPLSLVLRRSCTGPVRNPV
jgi:hypothetical protein